jgi:hypothetical protein
VFFRFDFAQFIFGRGNVRLRRISLVYCGGNFIMSSVPSPAPTGTNQSGGVQYGSVIKTVAQASMPVGGQLGWDGYVRLLYDEANNAIQQQANALLARGNITVEEARGLVESQRNGLVLEFRKPLTPWGKLYSEILKPSNNLPSLQKLIAEKGSIEAVMQSVGETRVVVNRIAVVSRVAGPTLVILSITFSAVAIMEAPAGQKGRVAATEVGGTVVGLGGGLAGAWAGCLASASFASPSLVIPGWGEVSTGGACLVGGIAGGLGLGLAGDKLGRAAGGAIYDFTTSFSY